MEELFRKFCCYYIDNNKEDLKIQNFDKLKAEAGEEFKDINKKALKYIKNLRQKAKKIGYEIDFASFCNCLENYINIKTTLTYDEKRNYLKVLMSMSQLYKVNLRAELEKYQVKNLNVEKIKSEKFNNIFKKIVKCELNNIKWSFNELKKEYKCNDKLISEIQLKANNFAKEIKKLTSILGFSAEFNDFIKMIDEYLLNKNIMTYDQKVVYLKILMYLSEIYDVNLRAYLNSNKEKNWTSNVSNPLEDNSLLSNLLLQRYHNGSFQIKDLYLPNDLILKEDNNYDYAKIQSTILYHLKENFLDAFINNKNLINEDFKNIIKDKDIKELSSLDENNLYNILKDLDKKESSRYICKKYKINTNIYKFINICLDNIINLKEDLIGEVSLFNYNNNENNFNIGLFIVSSSKNILEFISYYIIKCLEKKVCYNLKISDNKELTLYADSNDIKIKLAILDEIKKEFINSDVFGTPLHMTGQIDNSFYGIASYYNINDYISYINELLEVSYYRVISKMIISKISDSKALEIINDFISFKNIACNKDILPTNYKYNEIDFMTIKDLINQYIPLISNTLAIYVEDKKRNNELCNEFKKAITYLANISSSKEKKAKSNIVLNFI